jgi:hypothetical protein
MKNGASSDVFTAELSPGPLSIRICMTGDANVSAVDRVGQVVAEAHAQALRSQSTEVVVDVRQLEFMSSACFKKFVTWIAQVEEVDADSRYGIRFLSNPKIQWQRRSLHALHCFALDLVSVET